MSLQLQPIEEASCLLGRFSTSNEVPAVPGIDLIYTVDRSRAGVGETLTFTAWVLNSRNEILTDVCLTPRSLTNSRMVPLQYTNQPPTAAMNHRDIDPFRSLTWTFTYTIDTDDVTHAGALISSIQASLVSPSQGPLHSESDAIVTMKIDPQKFNGEHPPEGTNKQSRLRAEVQ